MKLAVLSNVNLDMLIEELGRSHELFRAVGYGQWVSYALKKDEALSEFDPAVIFLLIDGNALFETCSDFDSGMVEIKNCFSFIKQLERNYSYCTIAVSNIDIRPDKIRTASADNTELLWEAQWTKCLAEAAGNSRIVPFDLKNLIATEGRKNVYSEKLWYTGSIPYGIKSLKVFTAAINAFAENVNKVRKKVLVMDLDNTLWGGVAGEDGPQGIVLSESLVGAAYRDTQKRIKKLKANGVLLAIASKNNPEDVQAVFRENAHMVLKESDFVSMKINWQPKSVNIQQMAQELNLGLDAFVFLDDNEIEREAVRASLPQVNIAEFPSDIAMLPRTIDSIYEKYFWCARQTEEDKKKTQQYQQEAQRKQALSSGVSMDDYLKSLEISIELNAVRDEQYERTVQLMNKTNQFNTNTVRMDMAQFLKYIEDGTKKVYVANVSDRYGDSGLVSIVLTHTEGDAFYIDNMLMSCRVMGRQIEDSIVFEIEKRAFECGSRKICASFIPTAKNKPVEELWDRLGFELISDTEGEKHYELVLPNENEPLIGAKWKE